MNSAERIPAAIAGAKKRLGGDEFVLIPPHTGGNETEFTVCLTATEVALAEALWWEHEQRFSPIALHDCEDNDTFEPCRALVSFAEKMEGLPDVG